MTKQLAFDLERAEQACDVSMAQVEENAVPEWKDLAFKAVYLTAKSQPEFIVDAVWEYMPEEPTTHDLRAMGPIMRQAERQEWIERTTIYRLSDRVTAHRNPRPVWRSLIYGRETNAIR